MREGIEVTSPMGRPKMLVIITVGAQQTAIRGALSDQKLMHPAPDMPISITFSLGSTPTANMVKTQHLLVILRAQRTLAAV